MSDSLRRAMFGGWLLALLWAMPGALCGAANTPGGDGSGEPGIEQQLQQAASLRQAGRLERALGLLMPLSATYPRDFDVQWLYGVTLVDTSHFAEAVEILEPVVAWLEGGGMDAPRGLRMLKQKLTAAYFFRGRELQQAGRPAQALERLQ